MRILIASCAFLILAGAGCTSQNSPSYTSDFAPPSGKAVNAKPGSAGERRLLTAYSHDGIVFTPTGNVVTEQANVPDAIVTPQGDIYVYYVGQGIEPNKETTAVAISSDNGKTWNYQFLTFNDWSTPRDPADPDIVLLPDGSFRMYYTTILDRGADPVIAYAESLDGISFTHKGIALDGPLPVIDSTTFSIDGTWHMFVLDTQKPQQYHATSLDGTTFTLDTTPVNLPLEKYFIANQVIEDGVVRMYGFSLRDRAIRSFTTTDFLTWTAEDIALSANATSTRESNVLQDHTVVTLPDGTFLMIYVTEYPKNL